MAKTKTISLKAIKDAFGDKYEGQPIVITFGEGENAVDVLVKNHLTIGERRQMVDSIVDMLFYEDEDGVTHYDASLKNLAYDLHIVSYLTNVSLPLEADKIWEFLSRTQIALRVSNALPEGFVASIISAANEMIEFKKSQIIKQNKLDGILSGAAGLMKSISGKLEGADGEAIVAYLEKNVPEFKEKLSEVLKEQPVSDTAK